jgi:hypothetical protein
VRCERKDGTFYGTAGRCRLGVQNEERAWFDRESKRWPQHAAALEKLAEKVADLPESQRKVLNDAMAVQLSAEGLRKNWEGEGGEVVAKGRGGRAYTEEESAEALGRQINGWNKLIDSGAPTTVVLRNGQRVDPPETVVPEVKQSSGQAGYRVVEDGKPGTKLSITKEKGVYAQNRANKSDSDRVIHTINDFRAAQTKAGKPWPAQELEPRKDIELDPDKIWASLSAGDIRNIALVGLPKAGGQDRPGAEVFRFLTQPENQRLVEERARGIIERYVAQGGRSGVSGMPINIPGLKPDPAKGEEKSTVDHFNPISGSKGMSVPEIRKMFDHKGNFLLSEEGPNQARQENDWGGWVDKKLKTVGAPTPKAKTQSSTPPAPKQKTPNLTAEQRGTLDMLNGRIAKQAKEMKVPVSVITSDEDFLRMALGGKVGAWKQLSSRV